MFIIIYYYCYNSNRDCKTNQGFVDVLPHVDYQFSFVAGRQDGVKWEALDGVEEAGGVTEADKATARPYQPLHQVVNGDVRRGAHQHLGAQGE